jgi:putative RNA 2'-phosphotransferase
VLDRYGWAQIEDVVRGVKMRDWAYGDLTPADIEQFTRVSDVARFELRGDRIRALYGHSVRVVLDNPSEPPEFLFHGTSMNTLSAIRLIGLVPLERHYVHLTSCVEYAAEVQRKHGEFGALLRVRAVEAAHQSNVRFWQANKIVWLSDPIPHRFIELFMNDTESPNRIAVPICRNERDHELLARAIADLFVEEE